MLRVSVEPKRTSTVKDRRDLDDIVSKAVDDAVVAVDELTNRLVAKLRDDAARPRVILQAFHRGDQSLDDKVGVVCGVAGDMRAYRLNVLDRLGCPNDPRHRRSRRFASA